MTTYDFFKRAEHIELVSAAIYRALAERFRHDPDAHSLFAQLEAEEQQHARRIRLLTATYRKDSRILEKVNGAEELDACLAVADAALREVERGEWGPALGDVLGRVSRLEDRLANAHANLLALNGNGALREFFEQLARMDDAHVQLLLRT